MPRYSITVEADDSLAWSELSDFVRGYIEALFFTDNAPNAPDAEAFEAQCESGANEGSFPADCGFGDLAPESLAACVADCEAFQAKAAALLALAYGQPGYDEERAGNDFWYTRNGHGVGFWDRRELEGDAPEALQVPQADSTSIGDHLSALARQFGEAYSVFGDDRKVYVQ